MAGAGLTRMHLSEVDHIKAAILALVNTARGQPGNPMKGCLLTCNSLGG